MKVQLAVDAKCDQSVILVILNLFFGNSNISEENVDIFYSLNSLPMPPDLYVNYLVCFLDSVIFRLS